MSIEDVNHSTISPDQDYLSCSYEDSGLFIGFVTVPPKITPTDFFEKEIRDTIFSSYKQKIEDKSDPLSPVYYNVKAFYLFGDFDLALFSLIDDLEFSNNIFQPDFHDSGLQTKTYNYNYQVITGISPSYINNLSNKFDEVFMKGENRLPFVAITKFKINDGLLVGTGYVLLRKINEFIARQIAEIGRKFEPQVKIDFILTETFCNNEICVAFFSNSIEIINEAILSIRESSLEHLTDFNENWVKKTLLYNLIEKENLTADIDTGSAHIFTNTHSYLGYDLDYLKKPDEFRTPIIDPGKINMFNIWEIKPGHLQTLISFIKENSELRVDPLHIPYGKGALSTKYNLDQGKLPSIADYVGNEEIDSRTSSESIDDHYNRFKTYVNIRLDSKNLPGKILKRNHIHLSKLLIRFTFVNEINELSVCLEKFKISKVIRNRVLRIFRNYNDAIQDPLLFSYFIELHGYLQEVYHKIKSQGESMSRGEITVSPSEFHDIIRNYIDIFEKVYNNRYHQSYRMLYATDYNLEYSGGIQQLISSYDSAYKIILSGLGEETPISVVEVSDTEGVDSNLYGLSLNYLHIFLPELFATLVVKEAANYYHRRKRDGSFKNSGFYSILGRGLDGYNERSIIRENLNFSGSLIKSEEIREYMKSFIDFSIFNYFFVDRITFCLGFNSNKELFFNWFFFMYLQNTRQYQIDGNFSRRNIIQQLFRIVVLFYDDADFLQHIQLNPPSKVFARNWIEDFILARELAKTLFAQDKVTQWYAEAKKRVDIITSKEFIQEYFAEKPQEHAVTYTEQVWDEYETALENIKQQRKNEKNLEMAKQLKLHDQLESTRDKLNQIQEATKKINVYKQEKIEAVKNEFIIKLREGVIIERDKSLSDFTFVLVLSHALVSILFEYIKDKEISLDFYHKPHSNNAELSPVLADPLGGIFVPSQRVRKELFKCRAAFLKSLWNLNFDYKKNIFLSLYNPEETEALS